MNYIDILSRYYEKESPVLKILLRHSELVAKKALAAAGKVPYLDPDLDFIVEAAMLHDIGIFMTNAPALGCNGKYTYLKHGHLGREILEKIGLYRHALVCERHIGAGISLQDIITFNLPLPRRDMLPISPEEKIICYADKFYSKGGDNIEKEKSIEDIIKNLKQFGMDKVERFLSWARLFE